MGRVGHIIVRGMCSVRVPKGDGSGATLTTMTLRSGDFFGHGALSDPVKLCPYTAKAAVVVESTTAELLLLPNKSLFLPPDVTVERITKALENAEDVDPISQSGAAELHQNKNWEKQKKDILVELKIMPPT